jgi:hypothetical protein
VIVCLPCEFTLRSVPARAQEWLAVFLVSESQSPIALEEHRGQQLDQDHDPSEQKLRSYLLVMWCLFFEPPSGRSSGDRCSIKFYLQINCESAVSLYHTLEDVAVIIYPGCTST